MKKFIAALGIAGLAATASASHTPAPLYNTEMTGGDLQFLYAAGEEGLMQARLSDLASQRAWTGPVKTFGEAMLNDHAAEDANLARLAAGKRLAMPSSLNPRQKQIDKTLAKLSGEKFNKACLDEIIDVQQQQIADYELGSRSADPEIRKFAGKSLPALKEHLLLAKKIAGITTAGALFRTRLPVFDVTPKQPAATTPEGNSSPAPAAAAASPGGNEGSLELADEKLIAGWAYDPTSPNQPVSVDILDGNTVLATVVAKEFRGDLKEGGKGDGKHFFMLSTPASIRDGKPHWIRVAVAATHFELPGSPKSVISSGTTP